MFSFGPEFVFGFCDERKKKKKKEREFSERRFPGINISNFKSIFSNFIRKKVDRIHRLRGRRGEKKRRVVSARVGNASERASARARERERERESTAGGWRERKTERDRETMMGLGAHACSFGTPAKLDVMKRGSFNFQSCSRLVQASTSSSSSSSCSSSLASSKGVSFFCPSMRRKLKCSAGGQDDAGSGEGTKRNPLLRRQHHCDVTPSVLSQQQVKDIEERERERERERPRLTRISVILVCALLLLL